MLTALWQRERDGAGQHCDLSQFESMASFVADEVVGFQLRGSRRERMGNRDAEFAPQGIYRCAGEDAWVFLSARTDMEWAGLCDAIGSGTLAADRRLADGKGRKQHEDMLDARIAEWAATITPAEAMERLQAKGVPAGAVLSAKGLMSDPHLRARGFFVELEHPNAGRHVYPGQPIRLSRNAAVFRGDAPRLGEHNGHILVDTLGYSEETVAAMAEANAIVSRPPK